MKGKQSRKCSKYEKIDVQQLRGRSSESFDESSKEIQGNSGANKQIYTSKFERAPEVCETPWCVRAWKHPLSEAMSVIQGKELQVHR